MPYVNANLIGISLDWGKMLVYVIKNDLMWDPEVSCLSIFLICKEALGKFSKHKKNHITQSYVIILKYMNKLIRNVGICNLCIVLFLV